jgi:hypothetical protein
MTLLVQWWLFLPLDTRGRVVFLCRVTFLQMTDTGITFPSCYPSVGHFTNDRHWDHMPILLQYCESCPCVRHDPYLPSISASLQTPGRAELATVDDSNYPPSVSRIVFSHDDRSFIVLTETKFSFRCIPVWDRYSPHRTRVEKKSTCDNALTMTSPVHW